MYLADSHSALATAADDEHRHQPHHSLTTEHIEDASVRKLYDQLLQGSVSSGSSNDLSNNLARLDAFTTLVKDHKLHTLTPLLPLLLNLKGKPYTLADHFYFEPLFQTRLSREVVLKTARQLGKTISLAARSLLLCNSVPYFTVLFVTPLFEQIRRFSTQCVRPFIEESPVKHFWMGTHTENSVLQRSFKNGSRMFFSFAFLDPGRLRGLAVSGQVGIDETQDMDASFLPIIKETMSGPDSWRLLLNAGTPKTVDNNLHGLWINSSQGEWCILCRNGSCKHLNIPAMGHDLEKMIGPNHPDIGPHRAGIICARCGQPLDPRHGRWVHKRPELRWKCAGYHVPQIISPSHCNDRDRWGELLAKQRGYGNTTVAQFYNEVLGESYDIGTKLVNEPDLIKACCLPWHNPPSYDTVAPVEALSRLNHYDLVILAVDWGGGGEKEVSFTTCAVMGWMPNGKIDVIYGRRLLTPHDHVREAEALLEVFSKFRCQLLCHDYTGAGSLRETLMIQAGIPPERVVPITYVAAARQNVMVYRQASEFHPRNYWSLDKSRSLVLTCAAIKLGILRFFRYDRRGPEDMGLVGDFLALVENKIQTRAGSDVYTIVRSPMLSDDFAQACNIGCCTIWQRTSSWPNLAELASLQVTVDQMRQLSPDEPDWEGGGGSGSGMGGRDVV